MESKLSLFLSYALLFETLIICALLIFHLRSYSACNWGLLG